MSTGGPLERTALACGTDHYHTGNRLLLGHDRQDTQVGYGAHDRPGRLNRRMAASRPIIVGGCYRSGTSLVRRLLDAHPRIHCGPEVKLFRDLYGDYLDAQDPIEHLRFLKTARSLVPEGDLLEILGFALVEMHERAAAAAGKARWADKVPENIVFLDEWQRILGDDWVLLHVVRNPLDTLASIKEMGFPKSVPASLSGRIDLYCAYGESGLRFAERHPDRYVRIVYERLVRDPSAAVSELMDSLGEEFYPEQLAINASAHRVGLEDPKAVGASRIHNESIGRWRELLELGTAEEIARRTLGIWSQLDPDRNEPISTPLVTQER